MEHGTAAPGLFEVLAESQPAAPRCALEQEYGTALRLDLGRVAVNFVSTIDGIVSFGLAGNDSRAVSGGIAADRVLMAMLRAVAGVIVVGARTLRATLNHQWTATALAPEREEDLAELRAAAGLPEEPAPLLVVAGAAPLPAKADAVARPAVPLHVLRSGRVSAAAADRGRHAADRQPGAPIDAQTIVETARGLAGGGPILCEGGPHLLGSLLDGDVPIELFLTVAPQLAGRTGGAGRRRSLVEGVALPPFSRTGRLTSVRRAGSHLLLRYLVDLPAPADPGR